MTKTKTSAALEKKIRVACTELDQKGERITNANVREKTGGSFRDVSPIVRAILAERKAREVAESQVPAMPEEVSEHAIALWEAAYRAADATAAADRRTHSEQIKSLNVDLAERENKLAIIEDEKEVACHRAEAAERAVADGKEMVVQMKIAAALLEGRIAGLLEALKAQVVELPSEDEPVTSTQNTQQMLLFTFADDIDAAESLSDPYTTDAPDPETDHTARSA